MPLENRNIQPGTRLVGRYKKVDHYAEVVQAEDGSIRYRLEDGRQFKSPSSAGSAVMGGLACNGWRFWGLAEAGPAQIDEARTEEKIRAEGSKPGRPRKARDVKPISPQELVDEGRGLDAQVEPAEMPQ